MQQWPHPIIRFPGSGPLTVEMPARNYSVAGGEHVDLGGGKTYTLVPLANHGLT